MISRKNYTEKAINHKRGFTLIETLVAVLLLVTAVAGPLTIASKGLTATLVAKDQFIGFYLAQDAVEHIRFIRDSNTLSGGNWLTGAGSASGISLSACISSDGSATCYLDSLGTHPASPTACSGACPTLRFDTANKYYNYNSGFNPTPQRFTRTISIKNDGVSEEATVTVQVTWSDIVGVTRAPVIVRENIYSWQ